MCPANEIQRGALPPLVSGANRSEAGGRRSFDWLFATTKTKRNSGSFQKHTLQKGGVLVWILARPITMFWGLEDILHTAGGQLLY